VEEKLKKSQLAQQVKEAMGGNTESMGKLLNALIDEGHKDNETRRGEDYICTQGEIKAYRRLQTLFMKQKK